MTQPETKIDDVTVINLLYGYNAGAFTVNMKRVRKAKAALNKLLVEARIEELESLLELDQPFLTAVTETPTYAIPITEVRDRIKSLKEDRDD